MCVCVNILDFNRKNQTIYYCYFIKITRAQNPTGYPPFRGRVFGRKAIINTKLCQWQPQTQNPTWISGGYPVWFWAQLSKHFCDFFGNVNTMTLKIVHSHKWIKMHCDLGSNLVNVLFNLFKSVHGSLPFSSCKYNKLVEKR